MSHIQVLRKQEKRKAIRETKFTHGPTTLGPAKYDFPFLVAPVSSRSIECYR